jgi:hypothetical protein
MCRVAILYMGRGIVSEISSKFGIVSRDSNVHPTAQVWSFAEIREKACIGENVIIGS